jgi:RNA recognition motif-containing protein
MTSLIQVSGNGLSSRRDEEELEMKKIYVGNLSFQSTDEDLRNLFAEFGQVNSATIVLDRQTGRSRGFGFVEMEDDGSADTAIEALNGREVDGRVIKVNEARPRPPRNRSRW